MTQQTACPIETLPVGVVAARIQASPELAAMLPEPESTANPEQWKLRLRFILEAAMIGELDDMGLVDDMPGLTVDEIGSFDELGELLDAAYNPLLEDKLGQVRGRDEWEPVFDRMATVFGYFPGWSKDPMDSLDMLLKNQPSVVNLQVERLAKIVVGYGVRSPLHIAEILRDGGISVTRRVSDRALTTGNFMSDDFRKGDTHGVLELPEGTTDLRFTRPIRDCPVGKFGKLGVTAGEMDDSEAKAGKWRIGCPALKNSRVIQKLMGRSIDDSLQFGLLRSLLPA